MAIQSVTAVRFLRGMDVGRTRPVLLVAETDDGTEIEVVVKLRGRELSAVAQMVELVTAPLASALGLYVPDTVLVNIPDDFGSIAPEPYKSALNLSIGWNFGSRHIGQGFSTWPTQRIVPNHQVSMAADIFSLDLLVQNPDRRVTNPNVWVKSDVIGVFDHEQAFSFLYMPIIGGAPKPWQSALAIQSFSFMQDHAFYSSLKGRRLNLDPFRQRNELLSDDTILSLTAPVPHEWRAGNNLCEQIEQYLSEAREHSQDFVNVVYQLLQ